MKLNIGLITLSLALSTPAFSDDLPNKSTQANDPLNLNWINKQIDPSQDFYAYANGNWKKNNPIPPEYAS